MLEYVDASGQTYTEDQINKMAAEQKTSASAIIKSKRLTVKKQKERSTANLLDKFGNAGLEALYKAPKTKSFSGVTEKGGYVPDQEAGYSSKKKTFKKTKTGIVEVDTDAAYKKFDDAFQGIDTRLKNIQKIAPKVEITDEDKRIDKLTFKKPGSFLVSTLADDDDLSRLFSSEEEEGVDHLRTLYQGIPGLTFEETNISAIPLFGRSDITNQFDAVKAVYIDPKTNKRIESKPMQFDISFMNTGSDEKSSKLNENKTILKNFFDQNLQNVDLGKNQYMKNKLVKLTNLYVDKELTPEVIAGIENKYNAPDLFDKKTVQRPIKDPKSLSIAKEIDPNAVYTETIVPYQQELKQAARKILYDNPNISKDELDKRSKAVVRQMLAKKEINDRRSQIIDKGISKDRAMQSTLLVGSITEESEAVKTQNKLAVEINVAIANTDTVKNTFDLLDKGMKGFSLTADDEKTIAKNLLKLNINANTADTTRVQLKNGAIVPLWMYNAWEPLKEKGLAQELVNDDLFKAQNNNLAKLEKTAVFAEAAAKNYDLGEKYMANIAVGTAELVLDTAYIVSQSNTLGQMNPAFKAHAIEAKDFLNNIRQSYSRDISFDDAFSSVGDFGQFMAQEVSTQIPILLGIAATGGGAGATAFIGASTTGNKMLQMQSEVAKGQADYSDAEIWLSSMAYGAAEAGFSAISTIPILKRAQSNFMAQSGGESLIDNGLKAYFKNKTPGFVADQLLESAGEAGTQITQNIIDGNPVLQNVDHAAFSGFAMGTVLAGAPHIRGAYMSTFATYGKKSNIRKLESELSDLSKDYQMADTPSAKKIIKESMDEVSKNLAAEIEAHETLIGNNLRAGAAKAVISIETQKAKLQNEANEILANKDIPQTLKEKKLEDLRNKFEKLQNAKNKVVKPSNLMSGLSDLEALETNEPELYAQIFTQAKANVDKKTNGEPTESQITKEAYEIFLKGRIDKNIEQVSKVEGANVKAFNNKKEAIAFTEALYDAALAKAKSKEDIASIEMNKAIAITELKEGADGFNALGTQVIVKEAMLAAQRTEIGTHEVGHYALDKIFENNPEAFIPIAKQLLKTAKALDKNVYDRITANAEKDANGNFIADEVITRFLEEVSGNKITYASKAGGLAGIFGMLVQKEFSDQYDFDFKGETDMFNFVVGLGKKIANGTLTLGDIEAAKKSAANIKGTKEKGIALNQADIKLSKSAEVLTIEKKIQALEDQYDNDELDYDDYESRSEILKASLAKAIAADKAKPKEEAKPEVKKKEVVKDDETEVKEIINESKGSISSDKVQQIYNEKGVEGALDIIKLFSPITKKIVDKRRDAPGFEEELLTDEIETGDGGILSLIQKYDPAMGIPLAAYINKYLPVRAITASRRVLGKEFSKDIEDQKGLMATETAESGFAEAAKEKPTYKNALESKLLTPEQLKTAENKILTVVRTLKNRIDAPVSLNRTVTPIISEIRDAMGKQLDIDLKTIMGGKKDGVLRKWALDHKRYVLENMTTTWLMGLDGKGGIPQAIQKRIDGKWVSYPDWVGKKIDRESVSTDNAGRTSGAEISRRLPNVFNNVSDADYLGQLLEADGNPIRGRKESWAKAIAEELAFDIINNDLANEGPIFDALATNQERLGYEMLNNFATIFKVSSDRGNVKLSKAVRETMADLNKLPEDVKSKIRGVDGNAFMNYVKSLTNGEDPELKFHEYYPKDDFDAKDKITIINAVRNLYNYYSTSSQKDKVVAYGPKQNESFEDYANRKVFEALSKEESYATILGIPVSSLWYKSGKHRKAAQDSMKAFHKAFVGYLMENDGTQRSNANKLFTRLFSRGFSYGTGQSMFNTQKGFYNAFLSNYKDFNLAKSWGGETITYKGKKVNMDISSAIQDTSADDIANFIETGDPSKINYEVRKDISEKAREDLKTMMETLQGMYKAGSITNTQLGLIFKSLGGSMASPLKVAAELRYVADPKGYSKDPKKWVYEHTPPTSYISRLALGVITGKSDLSIDDFMDNVINNSYVAIIPKDVDNVINTLYKSTMPFSYKPGQNPLIRYFDVGFNGANIPALKDLSTGVTISNEILKNAFPSEIDIQTEKALMKTSFSKAPKGISVFDFDDTIGITEGNVLYIMPNGDNGQLNAEEFAKEGSKLLAEGAKFDFSEFTKVVDGKPGPMVEKMKKMIGKFGPENFFILTARPQAAAVPIHEFLSSIGIDIPLENITGLGNSTGQAKADWMTAKAAEGYNDFYFADDATQNVTAVKEALDVLDVKSKIQQARAKFSKSMSDEFNKIIEENKGVESYKVYSDIVAKRRGAGKNKFDLFVPPSAADFELLLYKFFGKGKRGEEQQKFFNEALIKPYINGVNLMDAARQSIKNSYKALTKAFPDVQKKLEKLGPDGDFTYDQAIRVALWNDGGIEIPGLTKRDNRKLVDMVNGDPELLAFKEGLKAMSRQDKGWVEPSENWDTDTIVSDLFNITQSGGRKKFLGEFIENVEAIFGKWDGGKLVGPNMNKIQAVYGTNVREALEDSIYRMTNGKNRSYGSDKETTMWTNWVTGATGVIMFLNTRSASLQLLSTANFLNLRDNNPVAAAKAFANQKQYWSDFATIWNSDKMKERRGGLREDVVASEIANAAAGSKNKPAAVIAYLLKIGYTPTQLADSFAISSGGAPYYRNRIKTHIKEGMSESEAEALAWEEFSKVTDETQQSGDPKDISKQQASGAGRLLLTFQNTAMQQSRLVKKAFLDLKNGRGDAKTNIAKISYYLVIQNTIFSVLQQGLFAVLFDEDEEEEKRNKNREEKAVDLANGVLDSILRGTGFYGGIAATLKNVAVKYMEQQEKKQKDYAAVVVEAANISPPIGSKLRKIYSGLKQTEKDKDLIAARGWDVMQDGRVHLGPNYSIAGKGAEVVFNVPMDRLVSKIENVSQALNNQNKAWQRFAVAIGFTPWTVGIEKPAGDLKIIEEAKAKRKVEGKEKAKKTREAKKIALKDSISKLSNAEYSNYLDKVREEKYRKREERRKRKMGGD